MNITKEAKLGGTLVRIESKPVGWICTTTGLPGQNYTFSRIGDSKKEKSFPTEDEALNALLQSL